MFDSHELAKATHFKLPLFFSLLEAYCDLPNIKYR